MSTRVAILGSGGYPGQDHARDMYLPALARREDVEVVGRVPFRDGDLAPGSAAESIPGLTLEAALEAADAAIVCVPLAQREAAVRSCIEAGTPCLLDKPAAADAPSITRLAELAEARHASVTLAHHFRHHPMFQAAAASIAGGAVGLPFSVQADLVVAGGESQGQDDLVNLGVHVVDLIRTLLVGSPAQAVDARATADGCVMQLTHANGVTSTALIARTAPLGILPAGGAVVHRYRVSGSHGTETIDLTRPALLAHTAAGERRRWVDGSSVDHLIADWLAACADGTSGAVGLRDAEADALILDAARRSLADGVRADCHQRSRDEEKRSA